MSDSVIVATPIWIAAVFGSVLGAVIGSFIGAVMVRLPEGRSVVRGRSTCDSCGARLRVIELIPLLSFVLQRGQCRHCGAAINRWQTAAEVGGVLIGVAAVVSSSGVGGALLWPMLWCALLGWQLLPLGLLDLRYFWLPDRLTGLLALSGLAHGFWRYGTGIGLLSEMLVGGALGYSGLRLVALVYRQWRGHEGLGAGDAKLLGAIGLWIGPVGVVSTLLGGSLVALTGALIMLVGGRSVGAQTAMPLGSALALAGWMVALLSGL